MALTGMEHYLVLTSDLDATRDFYQDALGMAEGFRPQLGFPGYWMYIGATPVIHIAEWVSYTAHSTAKEIPVTAPAPSTGAFDHVASMPWISRPSWRVWAAMA
jgi:catechol 2,3-dioxygenase-like lactoylglutathione lyase family enzyme